MIWTVLARIRRWRMQTVKPFGKLSTTDLRFSLGDTNVEVANALAAAFEKIFTVEVVCGNLLDLDCDAMVSPANSFGDMGGGIDKAIDDFFHGEAQRRIMAAIAEQYCGELPVGAAMVVPMSSRRFPFLIVAPTMRIPRNIAGSINAYLSMRAVLVALLRHNNAHAQPIRTIAICGLGTGVGGMHPNEAAEQMRAAFDSVIGEKWRAIVSPIQAPFALGRSLF